MILSLSLRRPVFTINGTYEVGCQLERKRVECALMIKAALADQSEE